MWVMYISPTGKEDTPYWSWFNANEYHQQKEGTSLHASDCLNTMTAGPLALSSSGLHSSGMTWLALFTFNLGIPSDHMSFLHKQCNNVDAF